MVNTMKTCAAKTARLWPVPLLSLSLLACLTFAAEPESRSPEHAAVSARITALRTQFNDAIARHDADAIPGFLDTPYQITTSTGQLLQSTPEEDAVAWAEIFRDRPDVIYVRTPEKVQVSDNMALAAESGTWTGGWSGADGAVELGGSYFAQWRRVGGDWKIRAEVFVRLSCTGDGC